MPDIAFISSLNAAIQVTKALIGVRDAAMIDAKVIELRDHLIEAQNSIMQSQAEQATLIKRVHDLEEEIARVRAWEEEKQRYQLIQAWSGCFVYALKEASKGTEPPHWICAHCYEDGRREILQIMQNPDRRAFMMVKCSHCSFRVEMREGSVRPAYA
jgi:hypothetical protein